MGFTYAPTDRARRILVAALAFALAIAFAVAASITPADAGEGDDKVFAVFIGLAADGDPSGHSVEVNALSEPELTVKFLNTSATNTQPVGTLFIDFSPHTVTSSEADINSTLEDDGWGSASIENGGSKVVISADHNQLRLAVDDSLSMDVKISVNQPGTQTLGAGGDQQIGVPGGGNIFTLDPAFPEPSITVLNTVDCTAEETCETFPEPGAGGDSGTAACPPAGCGKAGTLSIEFLGEECPDCVIWLAEPTGLGEAFYLIVQVPAGTKNPTIIADQFNREGTVITEELGEARNCQPPKRNFGCIDIKHPDYSKKLGIYPVRFPAIDPRGGYR